VKVADLLSKYLHEQGLDRREQGQNDQ
jgi:hypothetical protein